MTKSAVAALENTEKEALLKTSNYFFQFFFLAEPQVKFLVPPERFERKSRREVGRKAPDQSCISVTVGQRSLQVQLGEGEVLFCHVHVEKEENHGRDL